MDYKGHVIGLEQDHPTGEVLSDIKTVHQTRRGKVALFLNSCYYNRSYKHKKTGRYTMPSPGTWPSYLDYSDYVYMEDGLDPTSNFKDFANFKISRSSMKVGRKILPCKIIAIVMGDG